MRSLRRARMRGCAAAAALAVLTGCASHAGIEPSATPIDVRSLGVAPADTARLDWPGERWWERFGDPRLDALVERALQDNPTLAVSKSRLEKARALAQAADAARLPQVSGSLASTRQRYSANDLFPPPIAGSVLTGNAVRLDAAWELDVFGRNRALLDAALGQARAAQADLQAARVLLSTEVVRTWVQLARLVALRALAADTLRQRTQLRDLVAQRVRAGLDTEVELRQAEGAVADAAGQAEVLDEQAMLARNALAALALQPAEALAGLSPAMPAAAQQAISGPITADLLGRRADIVAARWRIEAALRDRDAAVTEFYPNVNLAAFAGFSSLGFAHWLEADSRIWGVGPALRLPVFDAGRLRANLRGKTADIDAAVAGYNAAVAGAVREVGDQLASLRSLERQRVQQSAARAAAESADALALQRYRAGLANYLTVLSVESGVLAQRRNTIELAARGVDLDLALVRALGGGYRSDGDDRSEAGHER
ncbi:MAG: RND transporter [Burkholderiales bacterium 70-64]|nr:MAG: RND transporter [Burkholderiales bacterium 70-64]